MFITYRIKNKATGEYAVVDVEKYLDTLILLPDGNIGKFSYNDRGYVECFILNRDDYIVQISNGLTVRAKRS